MEVELRELRKQIDIIDDELIHILAKRVNVVKRIGMLKKEHGLEPLDAKRWKKVLKSQLTKAKLLNISQDFIRKLYGMIHEHCLEIEKRR